MDPLFKRLNSHKRSDERLIHQIPRLRNLNLVNMPFPTVLVGGTNGKGSTANLLAQICMEAGLKVGLNTSPHLQRYNERVQINRQPISNALLTQTLEAINADFADFTLNYPEYSFLASLYAFRTEGVDIAIFEIGLGGRQDPANTLNADLSIITNIDLDHTDILGNTLEEIAYEKAGIIKPQKPFVCGYAPCLNAILNEVATQRAAHAQIDIDFSYLGYAKQYNLIDIPIVKSNVACAIKAAELLSHDMPIQPKHITKAVNTFRLQGRLQSLKWHRPLLCDVAHNPGSCKILAEHLSQHPTQGKTIGIFAVSESKDISAIYAIIAPYIDQWILPEVSDLAPPQRLREIINNAIVVDNTATALEKAKAQTAPTDRVVIFGSFYLIGEVLCTLSEPLVA